MRVRNWSVEMNTVIRENKHREYALGSWDCAIFANEAIQAMTGKNTEYLDLVAGKYTTEIGFMRALKKGGFSSLREYLIYCLGDPVEHSKAWRGDLAFYNECIGINVGPYSMFIGSDSFGNQPMDGSCLVAIRSCDIEEFFKVR